MELVLGLSCVVYGCIHAMMYLWRSGDNLLYCVGSHISKLASTVTEPSYWLHRSVLTINEFLC